jgi:hypothetical protein
MPKTPSSPTENLPVAVELIERRIYVIRGQKVMLDSDLAELYQVTTGNLNLAVRRNTARFPQDFMFQLTNEEHQSLLLQIARAKTGRGGRQTPPYAFTEHGLAMLSSVLNSERAAQTRTAGHPQSSGGKTRNRRANPEAPRRSPGGSRPGRAETKEPAHHSRYRLPHPHKPPEKVTQRTKKGFDL